MSGNASHHAPENSRMPKGDLGASNDFGHTGSGGHKKYNHAPFGTWPFQYSKLVKLVYNETLSSNS